MANRPSVEIYTKRNCGYCERAKTLLEDKGVAYDEIMVSDDPTRMEEMVERSDGARTAPQIFIDDERIGGYDDLADLEERGELDPLLGLETANVEEHRPVLIAGSGIAGLTAAIYAARANNDPLVLEGTEPGGQLTLTTDVANYPGFPDGIGGTELVQRMKEQAEQFGAEIRNGVVDDVNASDRPFEVTLTNGDCYSADAVIAASGASARTLGIPGEDQLMGYGLSTCATCDGAFFRDEEMIVVGGGDAAMEEANFLTKFASTVYLVHRREEFRAEEYWIDRIMERVEDGDVEILQNTEVTKVHGSKEEGIATVDLVRHPHGHPTENLDDPQTERFERDVGALFLAIGHVPNTEYLAGTDVTLDDEGYIDIVGGTGAGLTATAEPGLFGAGDVVDHYYQQAVTAGGMGSQAAIDADAYLDELERTTTEESAPAAVAETDD